MSNPAQLFLNTSDSFMETHCPILEAMEGMISSVSWFLLNTFRDWSESASYCSAWWVSMPDLSLLFTLSFDSCEIGVLMPSSKSFNSVIPAKMFFGFSDISSFAICFDCCLTAACLNNWFHLPQSWGGGISYWPLHIWLLSMSKGVTSIVLHF